MKTILLAAAALLFAGTGILTADKIKWQPLFNGKDFANWGGAGKTEFRGYAIEDGIIKATPKCKYLVSEQEYESYELRFKFKLTPGANNGLGIHYPGTGDPAYTGMELQILDNTADKFKDLKNWQYHGSLYTMEAALRGALKPVGEWNDQMVTVTPHDVTVVLNGREILKTDLKAAREKHPKHKGVQRTKGHLVWCGHKDVVFFKDIEIQLPESERE